MPQINLFFWLILILAALAIYLILVENEKAEAEIRKQGQPAYSHRQTGNKPPIINRIDRPSHQDLNNRSVQFLEVGDTGPISCAAAYDFNLPQGRIERNDMDQKQTHSGNCHICA